MKTLRICQENYEFARGKSYEFARKKTGTPRQINNIPAAPLETEGASDAAQAPRIAVFPSGPRFRKNPFSCALVQLKGCFRAFPGGIPAGRLALSCEASPCSASWCSLMLASRLWRRLLRHWQECKPLRGKMVSCPRGKVNDFSSLALFVLCIIGICLLCTTFEFTSASFEAVGGSQVRCLLCGMDGSVRRWVRSCGQAM